MNRLKKISLGLLLALNVTASYAAVTIIKDHKPVDLNARATFSQVGLSGEVAEKIKGYGDHMPFEITLDVVMPQDWSASYNDGALEELVDWNGGVSWPYVLEDLSKRNDFSVSIDWSTKTVDFFSHMANKKKVERESEQLDLENAFIEQENRIRNGLMLAKEKELRAQLELEKQLFEKQLKDSQAAGISSNDYVAQLELQKIELEGRISKSDSELMALKEVLDSAIDSRESAESVAGNGEMILDFVDDVLRDDVDESVADIDIESFKREYDNRSVLPLDASFNFFLNGGYKQEHDFYSPATYVAKKGKNVKEVISEWANHIGWDYTYVTTTHYVIDFDMTFEGNLREASIKLISLYKDSDRPLDVEYFPKQKLVLVQDLKLRGRK
jgi:hypothetical protein